MRLRLLMDVEMDVNDIRMLQELIGKQPKATVLIEGDKIRGARLMGATPVEVVDDE